MADFCQSCSIRIFGKDMEDFADLCQPEELTFVICEGCGPIWVDCTGKKIEEEENKNGNG